MEWRAAGQGGNTRQANAVITCTPTSGRAVVVVMVVEGGDVAFFCLVYGFPWFLHRKKCLVGFLHGIGVCLVLGVVD